MSWKWFVASILFGFGNSAFADSQILDNPHSFMMQMALDRAVSAASGIEINDRARRDSIEGAREAEAAGRTDEAARWRESERRAEGFKRDHEELLGRILGPDGDLEIARRQDQRDEQIRQRRGSPD